MAPNTQPIIIKRIEEDSEHAAHGGAWKVAYADFMTAMMAFFLLLWILAASDEEKLRGLADYFTPSLSQTGGRGDGFLDGTVLADEGVMGGTNGPETLVQMPSFGQENPLAVFDSRLRDDRPRAVVEFEPASDAPSSEPAGPSDADPQEGIDVERRQAEWADTQDQLEREIAQDLIATPELSEHLIFERRDQGLEIQIVDKTGSSMFDSGSARILDRTRDLLAVIADAIAGMPNAITISGHTDSMRYTGSGAYSNWELSADRANATRRVLVESGVSPSRIVGIAGLADTSPLKDSAPEAPENRRISVMVIYDANGDTPTPKIDPD